MISSDNVSIMVGAYVENIDVYFIVTFGIDRSMSFPVNADRKCGKNRAPFGCFIVKKLTWKHFWLDFIGQI